MENKKVILTDTEREVLSVLGDGDLSKGVHVLLDYPVSLYRGQAAIKIKDYDTCALTLLSMKEDYIKKVNLHGPTFGKGLRRCIRSYVPEWLK